MLHAALTTGVEIRLAQQLDNTTQQLYNVLHSEQCLLHRDSETTTTEMICPALVTTWTWLQDGIVCKYEPGPCVARNTATVRPGSMCCTVWLNSLQLVTSGHSGVIFHCSSPPPLPYIEV